MVTGKDGRTCLFWQDKWQPNTLESLFPQAHSFAKNKAITLQKVSQTEDLTELFTLPLSQTAFQQVNEIQQILNNWTAEEQQTDVWTYFSSGSKFKSSLAYQKLIGQHVIDPAFRWTWISLCQPKHKVFYWLLLKDRLSTRNILRRKNMHLEDYTCPTCLQNVEENAQHLFWGYLFAQQCWGMLNIRIDQDGSTCLNTLAIKDQLRNQFFMVPIIIMTWTIWKIRNRAVFENYQSSLQEAKEKFFNEAQFVTHRIKEGLKQEFNQWIQSLS